MKFLKIIIILLLLVMLTFPAYGLAGFPDLIPGQWYTNGLELAHDKGLIMGFSDGTIKPLAYLSNGQGAKLALLSRVIVNDEEPWYKAYIDVAKKLLQKEVDPKAMMTRQDFIILLDHAFFSDHEVPAERALLLKAYYEDAPLSQAGYEALLRAVDLGVTKGVGPNHLAPQKSITRAEAIHLLLRARGILGSSPITDNELRAGLTKKGRKAYWQEKILSYQASEHLPSLERLQVILADYPLQVKETTGAKGYRFISYVNTMTDDYAAAYFNIGYQEEGNVLGYGYEPFAQEAFPLDLQVRKFTRESKEALIPCLISLFGLSDGLDLYDEIMKKHDLEVLTHVVLRDFEAVMVREAYGLDVFIRPRSQR